MKRVFFQAPGYLLTSGSGKAPSLHRQDYYTRNRRDVGLHYRLHHLFDSRWTVRSSILAGPTINFTQGSRTDMDRMNSKTLLILDSKKGFKEIMFCSVKRELLARFWMILVTRTRALLTSKLRFSSGCSAGIEIAGPMKRRKTTLPTPICGAVAFPPNRAAVHTAIWWNISRRVLMLTSF